MIRKIIVINNYGITRLTQIHERFAACIYLLTNDCAGVTTNARRHTSMARKTNGKLQNEAIINLNDFRPKNKNKTFFFLLRQKTYVGRNRTRM